MKYFNTFSLILLLLLVGCDDAINVDPADEIVESNAITNVEDVGDAVIGVYSRASMTSAIYFSSLFTDELVIAPENNGQGIQTHTWSITSGNGEANGIYASYSLLINRANRVLEAMDAISPQTTDEENLLKRYRGELLALRAWAHFTLATYFSPSFQADALAVPYIDYVVVLQKPKRDTWGTVMDGVRSDLDMAETLIPESFSDVNYMTLDAITALRSRIALYTQNYDQAISLSSELISKYSLPSKTEFSAIWTDESNSGQIFKLARVTGDGAIGQLFNPNQSLVYFNPSTKLLDSYQEGDVRLTTYFDENNRIVKYPGTEGEIGLNDIKVFRVSEQYLIRAEAALRKSSPDIQSAQDDFNTLRRNRISGYEDAEFTTSSSALTMVMAERFREMPYEAQRFLDLKRTNMPVDRQGGDCESLAADACFLEADSYLWALPIPQSEIFVSDVEQNPGYSGN